jgi:hypothetical protein
MMDRRNTLAVLKLKFSSCSFTRSEIQRAAIFETSERDKKKSKYNALHHDIFRDENFVETISSQTSTSTSRLVVVTVSGKRKSVDLRFWGTNSCLGLKRDLQTI